MNSFFELINFYKIIYEFSDEEPYILLAMLDRPADVVDMFIKEVKVINSVVEIFQKNEDVTMDFFIDELKFSKESIEHYFYIIQVLFPDLIKIKNMLRTDQLNRLLDIKKDFTIRFLTNKKISNLSISEKLNVNVSEIKEILLNVPMVIENNIIIERLKEENIVRDFFNIHPHSILREAAKLLRISSQKLRSIVGKLRLAGEDIKANDVPMAVEKEIIGAKVIDLKINHPSMTTTEISLKLGISIQDVRRSINNMVRIWQVEKAESYEFHFTKTSKSLDEIKEEAWSQHNSSDRPSSRWMEMILSATEKQIAMHGLKAPEKLDIRQDIRMTKIERDSIINAAIAADSIEIDYKNIEVTGTHD